MINKAFDAAASYFQGPLTLANVPWLNLLGLLMILIAAWGLFTDRSDRPETARLYERMKLLYDRLESCIAIENPDYYPDIIGEIVSLVFTLECMKIVTPTFSPHGVKGTYRVAHTYFGALMPMIREGHIDQARTEAPRIIAGAGAEPSPLIKSRIPFLRPKWRNYAYDKAAK